ncbi:MAG: four helix bundle protein [Alphaproteobacteria bacterium]|jgi:four helix bundle protein|nr:four helix bundle protein [Alphaproteobacteria bacterium]
MVAPVANSEATRPRVSSVFELDVYQKAYQASLSLHRLTNDGAFPKFEHYGGLVDQLRRSSRSVCANLAEGWGKLSSKKERDQFTRTAMGSAVEVRVWLHYARDLGYLKPEQAQQFDREYDQIAAMLRAMQQR